MEMAPASVEAPSIGGRWLVVWVSWPAAQPAISTAPLTAIAAATAHRRMAPARAGNSFATLSSSPPSAPIERPRLGRFRLSVASRGCRSVDRVTGAAEGPDHQTKTGSSGESPEVGYRL
jgi:hypothetical protein